MPSTGGVFVVDILYRIGRADGDGAQGKGGVEVMRRVLWDRKAEGGFPGSLLSSFNFAFFLFYVFHIVLPFAVLIYVREPAC